MLSLASSEMAVSSIIAIMSGIVSIPSLARSSARSESRAASTSNLE